MVFENAWYSSALHEEHLRWLDLRSCWFDSTDYDHGNLGFFRHYKNITYVNVRALFFRARTTRMVQFIGKNLTETRHDHHLQEANRRANLLRSHLHRRFFHLQCIPSRWKYQWGWIKVEERSCANFNGRSYVLASVRFLHLQNYPGSFATINE